LDDFDPEFVIGFKLEQSGIINKAGYTATDIMFRLIRISSDQGATLPIYLATLADAVIYVIGIIGVIIGTITTIVMELGFVHGIFFSRQGY
jgi:hypothetical protein